MGGQPGRPLFNDADGDPACVGTLPLPGKQGHAAVDRAAVNGAGTSNPPPDDHGVSPSHTMDEQLWDFLAFPPFRQTGVTLVCLWIWYIEKQHKKTDEGMVDFTKSKLRKIEYMRIFL